MVIYIVKIRTQLFGENEKKLSDTEPENRDGGGTSRCAEKYDI